MLSKQLSTVGAILMIVFSDTLILGQSKPTASDTRNYFPTYTGTKWVYEITLGEITPLFFRDVFWTGNDGKISVIRVRGRLPGPKISRDSLKLVISVKGPVTKRWPLDNDGVELVIEKDDIRIFQDRKQVFWSMMTRVDMITFVRDRFEVTEVITFSPHLGWAPGGLLPGGGMLEKDGYLERFIFFDAEPTTGLRRGRSEDLPDELTFIGLDNSHLHFIRQINASEQGKGFTEETWFAKDRGLVRFEQKVEGRVSMKWKLVQFLKGTN